MPGIAEILQGMASGAREFADQMERGQRAFKKTADQAQRIEGQGRRLAAPSQITDPRRLLPSSVDDPRTLGGSRLGHGGGRPRTSLPSGTEGHIQAGQGPKMYVNRQGLRQTEAWVQANCTPVEVDVATTSSGVKTVTVYVCDQPHGDMYPVEEARMSLSSSGGGGSGRTGPRFAGRAGGGGISGSTIQGRVDAARPQETSGGGIDRLTGDLNTSLGEQTRILKSIDRKLSGSGTDLRAGGLV